MTYSLDLRERVVRYVNNGGAKAAASRKFEVSIWCVNDWCKRNNLSPKKRKRKPYKLDWGELRRHVQQYPDQLIHERASYFGVSYFAVWYALKQMKITHKKNI